MIESLSYTVQNTYGGIETMLVTDHMYGIFDLNGWILKIYAKLYLRFETIQIIILLQR